MLELVYTIFCPITRREGDILARIIEGERQNIIGPNVKEARIAAKLSQQQLADLLETVAVYICRGSISRIESGERTVTDIEIWGLSQILQIPIQNLFKLELSGEKKFETL